MTDIGNLEGIRSIEVNRFCRANIKTVEELLDRIEPSFTVGIFAVSQATGIKPDRLMELVPSGCLEVKSAPDLWIEALAGRLLQEAPPDDPWLKRCRFGLRKISLRRFWQSLKRDWRGWKKNWPIFFLIAGLLLLIGLAVRAAGGLQALPSPIGLHDRALVTVNRMEAGAMLKQGDLYAALLPSESDYFKPSDSVDGLILARSVAGQSPLRFRDVLRQQLVAVKDIQANAILQKEDVTLAWTPYQPDAVLQAGNVYGSTSIRAIRKDMVILTEFIKATK
jgi:flagella basal body P-ring formation protein FlgA